MRENLQVSIAAARQRGEALDHVLLYGPPGLGKTTLAYVIANELGVPIRSTAGPVIEKAGDLAAMLTQPAGARRALHRRSAPDERRRSRRSLYPAMEDYELDIMIGQGPGARSVKVPVQPFTLDRRDDAHRAADVAAARALRHRPPARLLQRARHRGDRRGGRRGFSACRSTTTRRRRSRGGRAARRASPTGCCGASAITRRCAPTATSRGEVARRALRLLEVDERGFDEIDRRLLRTIIDKFGGGPVGVGSLAAAMSEERDAIEDIYEPFLIQIGFLDRTPRGRVATRPRLRVFRAGRPRKGSLVVTVSRRPRRRARRCGR